MTWIKNLTCGNETCNPDEWCFLSDNYDELCVGQAFYNLCGGNLGLNMGLLVLSLLLSPFFALLTRICTTFKPNFWNVLVGSLSAFAIYWIIMGGICISIGADYGLSLLALVFGPIILGIGISVPITACCESDIGASPETYRLAIYGMMTGKGFDYNYMMNRIQFFKGQAPKLFVQGVDSSEECEIECCSKKVYNYSPLDGLRTEIPYKSWDDVSEIDPMPTKGTFIVRFSTDFYLNSSLASTVEQKLNETLRQAMQETVTGTSKTELEIKGIADYIIVDGKDGPGLIASFTRTCFGKALWSILGFLGIHMMYEALWAFTVKAVNFKIIKKISDNDCYPNGYNESNEDFPITENTGNLKVVDDDVNYQRKQQQMQNLPANPYD